MRGAARPPKVHMGPVTRETLVDGVADLRDRFLDLVGSAIAPDEIFVDATPGWTVHDVVAHMATVVPRYAEGPRGGGDWVDDPADLADLNEQLLRKINGLPMSSLLARIRSDVADLLDQTRGYGDDAPTYRFNGGYPVRGDDALGILAGEFLVHGWDVALTLGRRWPVTVDDVEIVMHGMEPVLPGFVDPEAAAGHTATYDVRIRGGSRHCWRFEDGELECNGDPGVADCHLWGDPRALLLVMYGRTSPWRAALTGKVLAWGRRPWLALSLPGRFHNP